MIKRFLVYSILVSMALHCTCRLGILDHLYQKRHEIAYTVGLISEIPIAMCSHDYDSGKQLKIQTQDNSDSVPQATTHAREINLFFVSDLRLSTPQRILVIDERTPRINNLYSLTLEVAIFHPPSILG